MKIVIVAEGKLKDRALRAAVDDYLARIRRYARCEELEVRDADGLARALPKDSLVVALEVQGEALSSRELAQRMEQWLSRGKGVIAFAIGGANGLPPDLSRAATARISLSAMTLPHRLARLILVEQVYRAFTILRGEPYARED